MGKKDTTFWGLIKFFFVIGLPFFLLFSLNFTPDYSLTNGILTLIIMFFLPGYSIVNILFNKNFEIPEILVLSMATSISVFILFAMSVHFSGSEISVLNILHPVIILSLILGLLNLFKNVLLTKKLHRVGI